MVWGGMELGVVKGGLFRVPEVAGRRKKSSREVLRGVCRNPNCGRGGL